MSHVLNIYTRHEERKETQKEPKKKVEREGREREKRERETGENDTAWKLTKKHQHQVKLLLLQPASIYYMRPGGQGIGKVALDIVVFIWNRAGKGGHAAMSRHRQNAKENAT